MKGHYKHSFYRLYFTNKWLHKNRFNRADIAFLVLLVGFVVLQNIQLDYAFLD